MINSFRLRFTIRAHTKGLLLNATNLYKAGKKGTILLKKTYFFTSIKIKLNIKQIKTNNKMTKRDN